MSETNTALLSLNKSSDLELILYHLSKHKAQGAQAYLVNLLYEKDTSKVQDYLPQLINIATHLESYGSYENYFFDSALKDHNLAIKLYWLLQANIEDIEQANLAKLEKMVYSLERIIVNGQKSANDSLFHPPHLYLINIGEEDKEEHLHKRVRADYFQEQHKLAYTLVKISTSLISQTSDTDTVLKAYLKNVDTWIKDLRFWYDNPANSLYTRRLFRGIILPLAFFGSEKNIEQIVRIPADECRCFKTKARVPYLIIVETISIDEEEPNHEVLEQKTRPPNDLLNVLGLESTRSGIILDKNTARFEGYQSFIENCTAEMLAESLSSSSIVESYSNPWGESWSDLSNRIRSSSPFGHYYSWKARGIIVKGHDDLRQELLAMQIIKKAYEVFRKEGLKLYLRPYEILIISHNSGIIELVPDAISLHSIKKNTPGFRSLLSFFRTTWSSKFEEAQNNFVESMAGYSLLCYILNLKDRHNGNILLDNLGHIVHIDFGFFLTSSPGGNLNFETAPFKLTKEMVELMGGYTSEMFTYFKILLYQGLRALRKHFSEFLLILDMMRPGTHLPCFVDPHRAVNDFKRRFLLDVSDEECWARVEDLISTSAENWKTIQYDNFQRRSNNIL